MQKLTATQVPVIVKQLVAKQGNKCAICGHHFTVRDGAVLDHDHDTGFIRGAIHRSCNQAEGKVKVVGQRGHKGVSSYDYIIGLGKYLEHHKVPKYNFIYPTHKTDDELRVIKNRKAREARAKRKQ
jgi:hypothetical protein